jgi:dihydroxyacetone kinase-like protein
MNLDEVRRRLISAANTVIASSDVLTQADQAVGDGDHGISMSRGFTAVKGKLTEDFDSMAALFSAVGQMLMLKVGGSSAGIFGVLFLSGSKAVMGRKLESDTFASFLEAGLEGIKKWGGANPGDKTMVDALEPAVIAAKAQAAAPLDVCIHAAAEAAWKGMESTKAMLPTLDNSKSFGSRALGHPDPGALSMALILRGLAGKGVAGD